MANRILVFKAGALKIEVLILYLTISALIVLAEFICRQGSIETDNFTGTKSFKIFITSLRIDQASVAIQKNQHVEQRKKKRRTSFSVQAKQR